MDTRRASPRLTQPPQEQLRGVRGMLGGKGWGVGGAAL
jgi:hypothetical protein